MMITLMLLSLGSQFSVSTLDMGGDVSEFCVCDGVLYASLRPDEMEDGASGSLAAFDLAGGGFLWTRSVSDDGPTYYPPWNLFCTDGNLYSITGFQALLCKSSRTGDNTFLWRARDTIIAPFIFNYEVIYIASKTEIAAIDSGTGEIVWRFVDESGEIGMYPTIVDLVCSDGRLYAGSIIPSIRCFDAGTGELVWKSSGVADPGGGGYAHTDHISDEFIFVSTASGDMTLLDPEDGKALEYIENCEYLAGDEDGIYIFSYDENLIQELDPSTGSITGNIITPFDSWDMNMVIQGDFLCLGTGEGWVWILERAGDGVFHERFLEQISDEWIYLSCQSGWIAAVSEDGCLVVFDTDGDSLSAGSTGYVADTEVIIDELGHFYFASDSIIVVAVPD